MSFAGPEQNAKWVADQGYAFEVWDDLSKALSIHYGAAAGPAAAFPKRITRVLDAQGRVVLAYDDVSVGTHPGDVLDDCRRVFK